MSFRSRGAEKNTLGKFFKFNFTHLPSIDFPILIFVAPQQNFQQP